MYTSDSVQSVPATLPEQVSIAREIELSYKILHPIADILDEKSGAVITIPFSSIVNKYRNFLDSIITETQLNDSDQIRYRFKPKTLSYDLYSSTELWDTLLTLNGCLSITEFKPVKVRFYDPSELKKYLNEMLILEGIVTP